MLHKGKEIAWVKSDWWGMAASLLCIMHCLAAPALISFSYVFNFYAHNHYWDYFFVGMATMAVGISTRTTPSIWIKWALWLAVVGFSLAIFLHEWKEWVKFVSLFSSVILVILHFFNWKLRRNVRAF